MIRRILNPLYRNLINIPGYKTNRKIVVFESDDWGSIRMPSLQVLKELEEEGLDVRSNGSSRYSLNDRLASEDDLELLFDLLLCNKDIYNNPVKFTALTIVANPDFKKIKKANFKNYFYEPFTDTLKRNKGCENSFEIWIEGISSNVFYPEFHGREHLNVKNWMRFLSSNSREALLAFDREFWSFIPSNNSKYSFQAAFDFTNLKDLEYHREVLIEGIDLFIRIFNRKPNLFVPPNSALSRKLEKNLLEKNIKLIGMPFMQKEPIGSSKYRTRLHYLGKKNCYGQNYIIRNCSFEPSLNGEKSINNCLYQIKTAFKYNSPAIIGTHRVNYIGLLNKKNRDNSLKYLTMLIKSMKKNWPDIEFLTTKELFNETRQYNEI